MQRAMDPSESPCENFFQYACGRWNKRNVIPEDRTRYTIFTNLRDDMQIKLKGMQMTVNDEECLGRESSKCSDHLYENINISLWNDLYA